MLSLNSPELDNDLLVDFDGNSLGGIPGGSIVDLRGGPQVGTTTFCLSLVGSAFRIGSIVVYFDTGGLKDISWKDLFVYGLLNREGWRPDVIVYDCRPSDAWGQYAPQFDGEPFYDDLPDEYPGNLFIFDKFNEFARGSQDERNDFIRNVTAVCYKNNSTAIFVSGEWSSTKNHEWVENQPILTQYSHVGIALPRKGCAELCHSRITQYPRRVEFEYTEELREYLPGPFKH